VDLDLAIVVAGLLVGFVVGLTGMGGGALMTPVLVLIFNIAPLAAVSSDLVAAAIMKPVGSAVHMRRGTIHWGLVRWLMIGSVPSAFAGVLVLRALGGGDAVQQVVKTALGVALLLAATGLVVKAYLSMVEAAAYYAAKERGEEPTRRPEGPVVVRPVPTLIVGALGALYPTLRANTLVGTDLVQAVPLVASAALGHILFGDFQLALTTSLLIGSIPGVWLGAQLSSRAPAGLIRRALAVVLLASALKLLVVPATTLGLVLLALLLAGPWIWAGVRARNGLPRRALTMDVVRRSWREAGATD
jgi:uncharacterized protein